jgi:hypothetical protein
MCCCKGTTHVEPIQRNAEFEAVCADPRKFKLLISHARQFNNAFALASIKAKCPLPTPPLPGGGTWNPSAILEGKLHHYFGCLNVPDGKAPLYAQLYVSDPSGQNTTTVQTRMTLLHLPKDILAVQKQGCINLLNDLPRVLQNANKYIRDFITAGEIMRSSDDIPERIFVIDNKKRAADAAHSGVYGTNGTRRAFVEVKVLSDEAPANNAIVLRNRDGIPWETDNTNKAYDALHFVLLFLSEIACYPFGAFAGSHCLPVGYYILWDFGSVLWDACGL